MKEKQIEEIAKFTCNSCEMGCGFTEDCCLDKDYKKCELSIETATAIYNAGYRKQSEGEWISLEPEIGLFACSLCDHRILRAECNFCPNCGAKMVKGKTDDHT